ncbi:MAG TPA: hypothetical protein VGM56_21835, partial [Byssovorax sp.]
MIARAPSRAVLARRSAAAAITLAMASCSATPRESAVAVAVAAPPSIVAPPSASGPIRYEVDVAPGAASLAISVDVPRGPAADFTVEDDGASYVHAVTFDDGKGARPLAAARDGKGEGDEPIGPCFHVPACEAPTCRVRYRFDLEEAARAIDDETIAASVAGAFVGSPSTWLLHPELVTEGRVFTLAARAPAGLTFATGLLPDPGDPSRAAADVSDLPRAPYGVIGAAKMLRWQKDGFALDVARLPGPLAVDDAALARWVDASASAVLAWAGRAPIARALVVVSPARGHGVGFARTLGNGGASVLVPLGAETTEAELAARWELVHELLHVSFP